MYKELEGFQKPRNDNARIWRYMDFTKFISLLDKSALFFTRVDKLDDPFEGACPIEALRSVIKRLDIQIKAGGIEGYFAHVNKFITVNCWHLNQYESAAMWKIYLKSNEGIAVQSTFKRLKDSLRDKKHDIYIGKVKYIDYDRIDKLVDPMEIFMFPVMYKRKIFRHEQELRAVIRKLPKSGFVPSSKPTIHQGIYIPVDLNILIDKIYLAPTSPTWQYELLKSIIGKYQLNKKVIQSSIDDKPLLKYKEFEYEAIKEVS